MQSQEYRQRLSKLAAGLREVRLDGVLLSAEQNIDYFCGFRHHAPWSVFARPYLLVMNADGRAALVTHGFLRDEICRAGVVDDVRAYARSGAAPVALLADTMRELGLVRGRLGAELGHEQRLGMSWDDFAALGRAMQAVAFVNAADLIWRQRMIKSPAELALLRHAADITARAFEACFTAARPGITERQIARLAAQTMIEAGADRPGFILVISGPGNYHRLSGKPSDRKLAIGDMLWIDMGAIVDGYWADFSRAAVLGPPSREQMETQQALLDVNAACIAAAKPGLPVSAVARAAEAAFQARGYDVRIGEGRIGHGMGLMATEPPHVALYEQTPMQEGLFFTIEPRLIRDFGVFNCEEELVVTATEAELLTKAPRALTVIA